GTRPRGRVPEARRLRAVSDGGTGGSVAIPQDAGAAGDFPRRPDRLRRRLRDAVGGGGGGLFRPRPRPGPSPFARLFFRDVRDDDPVRGAGGRVWSARPMRAADAVSSALQRAEL